MAENQIPKYTSLGTGDRAAYCTSIRLLSCLVTESLVDALFYPLHGQGVAGFAAIQLQGQRGARDTKNLLALLPLLHTPIFRKGEGALLYLTQTIGLLDPLDAAPYIYVLGDTSTSEPTPLLTTIANTLSSKGWKHPNGQTWQCSYDPVVIWRKFASATGVEKALQEDIESEFTSSVKWQKHSFEYPPPAPSFSSLSVAWEQSIVEGHPTHPMHKTRRFLPPIPDFAPGDYDLSNPKLRFVAMPRNSMKITYNFEELVQPVLKTAAAKAGRDLVVPEGHIIIPVHELQLYHIQQKFPEVHIIPKEFELPLLAQQSLRSVVVPEAYRTLHLKLGVGIKLTSAVRTISPESAYLGPRFSAQVEPVLTMDRELVTVARELASVVHSNPNGEIAKHCAALVREYHEGHEEERHERHIVCTSLVERGHSGPGSDIPLVIRVFELDTEEKRAAWLERFVDVFFRAFLPPVLKNGVAFECHPQNCVARFDATTKELKGFIIRDFGGIRVHPPTLKETTGVDLDFIEGHSIIAPDLDDVYTRLYHTVFHNHFQQLIRVLDLHYNGRGWAIVRKKLKENISKAHPLYDAWLSPDRPTLPGKCFMRMRMSGMYRFHLHGPFPNLIHYRGEVEEGARATPKL
ncbi:IucC family-domain-containing protein [Ephemerocybe angulata]|uniref:IucC family-domain-containing protein n=1 Tax=Ephemerocybe angulata TaxID=980116 RepID=A0A8H6M687_9AGAR|nr:IucC family-domain-containing protein [Tulosesus angulatus]